MKRSELKRKTPLRAKKPMDRTGTLRTVAATKAANFARSPSEKKPAKARARMKSSRPKMTPIRKSARGEDCLIQLPGGQHDPATTVLCHSNQLAAGKGMGLKAPDTEGAYGCHYCHDIVDGRRPLPPGLTQEAMLAKFERAIGLTQEKLKQKGLM
jgi:hypothetical protein